MLVAVSEVCTSLVIFIYYSLPDAYDEDNKASSIYLVSCARPGLPRLVRRSGHWGVRRGRLHGSGTSARSRDYSPRSGHGGAGSPSHSMTIMVPRFPQRQAGAWCSVSSRGVRPGASGAPAGLPLNGNQGLGLLAGASGTGDRDSRLSPCLPPRVQTSELLSYSVRAPAPRRLWGSQEGNRPRGTRSRKINVPCVVALPRVIRCVL